VVGRNTDLNNSGAQAASPGSGDEVDSVTAVGGHDLTRPDLTDPQIG